MKRLIRYMLLVFPLAGCLPSELTVVLPTARITVSAKDCSNPPVTNPTTACVGTVVQLDGSTSSPAVTGRERELTFRWAFAGLPTGSTATLNDPSVVNPSFTVDTAGVPPNDKFVVQLIVNDGVTSSAPVEATITGDSAGAAGTTNPIANAGPNQNVDSVGDVVSLDGCQSFDQDESGLTCTSASTLTFTWTFLERPGESTAALNDPASPKPFFVTDGEGNYILGLTVRDGTGRTSTCNPLLPITSENDLCIAVIHALAPDAWTKNPTGGPATAVLSNGGAGTFDELSVESPLVLFDASLYKMWYSGLNAGGFWGIGLATSANTNGAFAKSGLNPVLSVANTLDCIPIAECDNILDVPAGSIAHPMVIPDGTTFKMWMAVHQKRDCDPGAGIAPREYWEIFYSTSPDGIAWTAPVRVLTRSTSGWDAGDVLAPAVIQVGSQYIMWYAGDGIRTPCDTGEDGNGVYGIGVATSPDGTTWTKFPGNPLTIDLNGTLPGSPFVLLDGAQYKMWFGDIANPVRPLNDPLNLADDGPLTSGDFRISYNRSIDGQAWSAAASLFSPFALLPSAAGSGAFDTAYVNNASLLKRTPTGSPSGVTIPVYLLWFAGSTGTALSHNSLQSTSADIGFAFRGGN